MNDLATSGTSTGAPSGALIGTAVLRTEDPHLLQGDTTYVPNLDLADEHGPPLVAHYITSIPAHATITAIDVDEAKAMPGVVDVLTAADLIWNGELLGDIPGLPDAYPDVTGRPIMASDRVRFVGETVAVVVAKTEAQAADAAEAVFVDYEPLPVVVDPRTAADSETLLFEGTESNVVATGSNQDDAIDFSDCEVVVTETFHNQRLAPCPIETRTGAALWTDDGRLVQYASCQGVHPIQKAICSFYGLDAADVRVITADVGGSFGAKARFYPEDLLLPFLAKRFDRPVRWFPARSADMVGLGHSRAQHQTFTIGGDRDGTIKAMEMKLLVDAGAYPAAAFAMAANAGRVMPGPMRVDRARWSYEVVVTNTTPSVAYRGAGRPEGGAAVDRAVDRFATEVGLDPLEIRRLNMLRADELPWTNSTGVYYDSGDYHEALDKAVAEVGYHKLRTEQADRRARGDHVELGIGISTFIDRTAGVPGSEYGSIELNPDGGFRVLTGSSPYGQGHYTSWAMLVAERTGVGLDRIEVTHGDTDVVPRGGITGGSRSAQKAGTAVVLATEELVTKAKAAAARLLEAAEGDVVLDVGGNGSDATAGAGAGRFHVAGAPGAASVGWVEVGQALAEEAAAEADDAPSDSDYLFKCESDYEPDGPTVPYGAYIAVVEVDTETGGVQLVRMVTVDDAGTILNPMLALGQVHGGVGQAIAQALFEEFVYDEDGNPLTTNFMDYAIPSTGDFPSFESHLTENPSPQNPLGFKGIGESGTIGGVPAVQNAVIDALSQRGIRHLDLPVTSGRIWEALRQAGAIEESTS